MKQNTNLDTVTANDGALELKNFGKPGSQLPLGALHAEERVVVKITVVRYVELEVLYSAYPALGLATPDRHSAREFKSRSVKRSREFDSRSCKD